MNMVMEFPSHTISTSFHSPAGLSLAGCNFGTVAAPILRNSSLCESPASFTSPACPAHNWHS